MVINLIPDVPHSSLLADVQADFGRKTEENYGPETWQYLAGRQSDGQTALRTDEGT